MTTTNPEPGVQLEDSTYRRWHEDGMLRDFKPGDAVVVPGTGKTGRLFATMQAPGSPVLEVSFVPDDGTDDVLHLPATVVRCPRCGTLGGHLWQWLQHPNPPRPRWWRRLLTQV